MVNLNSGNLNIIVSEQEETLHLDWRGKSADRKPQLVLGPFFDEIAAQAEKGSRRIEMHFENLEHFNSSTITVLIQLIQKLRQKEVALRIVFNAEYKWQRLSFDALRIFEKPDGLLTLQSC